jgi:type II secretory ATPase GspE/PulE/Tfp pilus assembly ATPase PilB-like protein
MEDEIRLPLSPTSIAGYVAMSQQPVIIDDVYDADALSAIHTKLRFDYSFDQASGYITHSMIVVPVKFKDTLLGVLQIINRQGGGEFMEHDLDRVLEVADVLSQKFRYDLKTTVGPYDYLLQTKKISLDTLEELEEMSAAENKTVTQLLVTEAELTPDEIGYSLEQYYQVPFFKYDAELEIDNEVIDQLNKSYLASNFWLPLMYTPDKAIILIDDPNDSDRIMEIQNVVSAAAYEFLVGFREDILKFLGFGEIEQEISEPEMGLQDLVGQLEAEMGEEEIIAQDGMDENASTIVQLVNRIIYDAVDIDCSDIHIEPSKGKTPGVVRMRVDGVCRVVLEVPASHMRPMVARIKVLSMLDITEKRLPQDGKMAVRIGGESFELRVATLPVVHGESAILRILAQGDALPYDKLGFTPPNYQMIDDCLSHPHGLFLVVGPTGSGKTTTLHGLLGHLNKPDKKIITAENPVEITQPGLQQVQTNEKIGYTFAIALRAFLRCDPDIILIGEMRDYETAHMGIEAAMTGHLVFSTLHTNSAAETITRLLGMGLDPVDFADAFIGVVAQRLMRTLCGKCKTEFVPDQELFDKLVHIYGLEYYEELGIDVNNLKLNEPSGCEACSGTGYKGRAGIHEVLVASEEIIKLIVAKAPVKEIEEMGMSQGLRLMEQDGVAKIFMGIADLDQLRRVCAG